MEPTSLGGLIGRGTWPFKMIRCKRIGQSNGVDPENETRKMWPVLLSKRGELDPQIGPSL